MRPIPSRTLLFVLCAVALCAPGLTAQDAARWRAHDTTRPKPVVISPAPTAAGAPSDAIVLFDGTDLSEWTSSDQTEPSWILGEGYVETVSGRGPLVTRRSFGDMQLHIEWAAPMLPVGEGQGRGNSGVIIMGRYEVQVLDSYQNVTYADGQAASVYGQYPPLVNASRPPGEWQSYDIVFRRPRFGASGELLTPARVTVFHNGVLVQDDVELWGETNWLEYTPYSAHEDALPLVLQDHANPVRYRNIWVRELAGPQPKSNGPASVASTVTVSRAWLESVVGTWGDGGSAPVEITLQGGQLRLALFGGRALPLVAVAESRFVFQRTDGTVEFAEHDGQPMTLRLEIAELRRVLTKQR